MSTMILLAWMAVVSAIIQPGSGFHGNCIFFITQVSCMIAGMMEAGSKETGRDSRWRASTRFMALIFFSLSILIKFFFPGV